MAHDDKVLRVMESIKIADKHVLAQIMASQGIWKAGTSAVNNSYKALTDLTAMGKLVKGDGYFKTPDCRSEYADHARLLTKSLSELYKHSDPIIFREHTITEVAIRPDALVLSTKSGKGICFVLEVCHTETPEYLNQKVTTWRNWDNSLNYLSELFGYKIPHFEIVVDGEAPSGCYEFNRFIEEVVK